MFKIIYAIFFVVLMSACVHQKAQSLRQPNNNEPAVCETLERVQTRWVNEGLQSKLAVSKYNEMAAKHNVKTLNIAVVDVAFGENLDELENSKKVHFVGTDFLNNTKILKPKGSSYPHGYYVVNSMLSKYGLPLPQKTTIYLYTIGLDVNSNSIDPKALQLSLVKACESGQKIINISANPPGEMGDTLTENLFEKELELLNNKGCLVVASAGNFGVKNPDLLAESNMNDSFLRVAAHGAEGYESRFSNLGEIAAPERLQIVDTNTTPGLCDGKTSIFDGTSASAPMVSVLVSMVYSLLETQKSFLMKSGPEKIKTVIEIVRQSADGPNNKNIDAFKAMLLVENYIQNN